MLTINTLFSLIKIDKTALCTIKLVIYLFLKIFCLIALALNIHSFVFLLYLVAGVCIFFLKKNTDKIYITFLRRRERERERESQKYYIKVPTSNPVAR